SSQTCQTRSTGASKCAVTVIVRLAESLSTLSRSLSCSFLRSFDNLADALDAVAPQGFQLVQQEVGPLQGRRVAADPLLTALEPFHDQPCSLQDRRVLLHRREAHREAAGEVRDRVLPREDERQDVPTGPVAQRGEDAVCPLSCHFYNHLVVR